MLDTIVGALLPVVVTLLFGFFAGWHHDFDTDEATTLNRMVMLYALPLSLFAGIITTSRTLILEQGAVALMLFIGLVGSYSIVYALSRYVFHRPAPIAALQAFTISGPSVAFVGFPVLGDLFGAFSSVPIALGNLFMNLIQVPITLYILESARTGGAGSTKSAKSAESAESAKSASSAKSAESAKAAGSTGSGGSTIQTSGPSPLATLVKTLKEPMVWAPLVAFVLLLTGFRLPPQTAGSLDLLGKVTGGVSIFAAGIVLFSRKVSLTAAVGMSVLSRNVLIPIIMLGVCVLFGLGHETVKATVLPLAIPTASLSVIMAVQYKTAEQETASALFFSTILSVLTMGGFIYWLG